MVQGPPARVPAQAGAWVEVRARVEAEWAGHSLQDRVEIVYARAVVQRFLILPVNLAIKEAAQNVDRR